MEGKASQLKNVGLTPGILFSLLTTMFQKHISPHSGFHEENLHLNSFQARISILSLKWLMKRCVHSQSGPICPNFCTHGLQFARLLSKGFPSKNTETGCHSSSRIFMTQASNSCFLRLLHWQENSLPCHMREF